MSEGVIIFIISIGLTLLGWAVILLLNVNNKVTTFCEWKENHEEQDKERHQEDLQKFKEIFEELRHIRRAQH